MRISGGRGISKLMNSQGDFSSGRFPGFREDLKAGWNPGEAVVMTTVFCPRQGKTQLPVLIKVIFSSFGGLCVQVNFLFWKLIMYGKDQEQKQHNKMLLCCFCSWSLPGISGYMMSILYLNCITISFFSVSSHSFIQQKIGNGWKGKYYFLPFGNQEWSE